MTSCAAVSSCLRGGPSMTSLMYLQRIYTRGPDNSPLNPKLFSKSLLYCQLYAERQSLLARQGMATLAARSFQERGLGSCHVTYRLLHGQAHPSHHRCCPLRQGCSTVLHPQCISDVSSYPALLPWLTIVWSSYHHELVCHSSQSSSS